MEGLHALGHENDNALVCSYEFDYTSEPSILVPPNLVMGLIVSR